jgi:hypothetical protein
MSRQIDEAASRPGRKAVLVRGVPTDEQLEEMLDALGFAPEAVDEHATDLPSREESEMTTADDGV